ncbi:MAG: hypothetical protein P4L99_00780 [Chthoniobacter sp.]|nr:hypothetical protein [Chthoniobacter sp.]
MAPSIAPPLAAAAAAATRRTDDDDDDDDDWDAGALGSSQLDREGSPAEDQPLPLMLVLLEQRPRTEYALELLRRRSGHLLTEQRSCSVPNARSVSRSFSEKHEQAPAAAAGIRFSRMIAIDEAGQARPRVVCKWVHF